MSRRMQDDRGAALIVVIVLGFISVLLLGTALTAASSGLRQAVSTQQTTSALDAAFAGVQDYVGRLNLDDSYATYSNPSAPFTADSGVPAAKAKTPPAFNAALGVGGRVKASAPDSGAWSWASVPGSDDAAKFRYEVDNSAYSTTGVVRLRSTGLAGTQTRALLVSIRIRGFVDYSYFTDLEMQDPVTSGDPQSCAVRAPRPSSCKAAAVKFYPDDALSGDVHSNDLMIICSATFTGRVTTYYTGNPLWSTATCDPGTGTRSLSNISHADELALPASNTSMEQQAGCVYAGPTQVTYNPGGTMTVVSPWTLKSSDAGRCGTVQQLRSPFGATVKQLDQDALYVKTVPADPADPNYWSSTGKPPGLQCVDARGLTTDAADGVGWQLQLLGAGVTAQVGSVAGQVQVGLGTIRYPRFDEVPATIQAFKSDARWDTTRPAYGCRNGDLYVQGEVSKQTTAASDNYVYVTGDLTYADPNEDVLGLVGEDGVTVWNPMKAYPSDPQNPYRPILTDSGRTISAAMLSVKHTFGVQNFDRGTDRGSLKVFGSIGQRFRGVVSAKDPSTGYDKSYQYDPLLKVVTPPKFLATGSKSFSVSYYATIASPFAADGHAL